MKGVRGQTSRGVARSGGWAFPPKIKYKIIAKKSHLCLPGIRKNYQTSAEGETKSTTGDRRYPTTKNARALATSSSSRASASVVDLELDESRSVGSSASWALVLQVNFRGGYLISARFWNNPSKVCWMTEGIRRIEQVSKNK